MTLVDTQAKLLAPVCAPVVDPSSYHNIVRVLQYFTLMRPDLTYVVQQACLHMHAPREPHLALVKCILRYVKGTLDHELQLYASSVSTLMASSNTDWASYPDSHCSTTSFCVNLGDSHIS